VSEDLLDRSQVRPRFEQMRGEAMPQRMARHPLLDPRRLRRALDRFVVDLAMKMMPSPDAAFGIDRQLLRGEKPVPFEAIGGFAELPRQGTGDVDARDTVPLVLLP
jgi:hypothetical protein